MSSFVLFSLLSHIHGFSMLTYNRVCNVVHFRNLVSYRVSNGLMSVFFAHSTETTCRVLNKNARKITLDKSYFVEYFSTLVKELFCRVFYDTRKKISFKSYFEELN
jgi:hypothetical protein